MQSRNIPMTKTFNKKQKMYRRVYQEQFRGFSSCVRVQRMHWSLNSPDLETVFAVELTQKGIPRGRQAQARFHKEKYI